MCDGMWSSPRPPSKDAFSVPSGDHPDHLPCSASGTQGRAGDRMGRLTAVLCETGYWDSQGKARVFLRFLSSTAGKWIREVTATFHAASEFLPEQLTQKPGGAADSAAWRGGPHRRTAPAGAPPDQGAGVELPLWLQLTQHCGSAGSARSSPRTPAVMVTVEPRAIKCIHLGHPLPGVPSFSHSYDPTAMRQPGSPCASPRWAHCSRNSTQAAVGKWDGYFAPE